MPSVMPLLSSVPYGAQYAVHISRVDNGWIVQHIDLGASGFMVTNVNVHSDTEDSNQSLLEALYVSFEGHFRSKRQGGLVLTNESTGYENERTGHTSKKYVFYDVPKPIELPGITILPDGTPVDKNSNVIQVTLRELQETLNANRKH